jgi:hypothetical protein
MPPADSPTTCAVPLLAFCWIRRAIWADALGSVKGPYVECVAWPWDGRVGSRMW